MSLNNRTLPLESLVRRLELSGFHLTPTDRIRFLEVLGGEPAKALLKTPWKLKYILAPIVAKSASEQEKFYLVFDQFYQEISTIPELEPLPDAGKPFWADNVWWILPVLLILAGIIYIFRPKPEPVIYPVITLNGPTTAEPGDTLAFSTLIQNADSNTATLSWFLLDGIDSTIEARAGNQRNWQLIARSNSRSPVKVVRVEMKVPGFDSIFTFSAAFGIFCPDPPELGNWAPPSTLEAGEPFTFKPPAGLKKDNYQFEWSFGDGDTSTLREPTHAYAADGVYYLQLRVTRSGAESICTAEAVHRIAIGEEAILLNAFPLEYDWVTPRATWGWGAWILVGILIITIFYYLIRWFKRPYPQEPAQTTLQESMLAPDSGPYFIPFRQQNSHISPDPSQYRLADMLRLRQEGLRQEVDVPASVRETIQGGGFPVLQFRTNTQPTDYLILVDDQSSNSHQARLFQHLVTMLRDQDVHADVFHYERDLFRLWNDAFPGGINLNMVHRLFPDHRLIVIGDAHELLDPYASGKPSLRKGTASILKSWKNKLLLTPLSPASWTFREATLSELFVLFPADTDGLAGASRYIENGLEPTDLPPSFREWQERQIAEREDANLNYREWRTLADHEDYLANEPELLRWLKALAVYPTPTWEITLAIGTALGIDCRFDPLLKLSRIPWLQHGDLHPRLRKQLLARLDPQDEILARNAVKQELEAVAASVKKGFAGFELQTSVAVQNFALSPFDPQAQEVIREYLNAGALSRTHMEELERSLPGQKEQLFKESYSQSNLNISKPSRENSLEDFLDSQVAQQVEKPKPPRPVWTKDFWRMLIALSGLFMLYFAMWNLDSTEWLYQTVFGEKPEPFLHEPESPLRDYYLVKESIFIDSAAQYNNQAVESYFRDAQPELDTIVMGRPAYVTFKAVPAVRSLLNLALLSKEDYPLASNNLGRLEYAAGVAFYNFRRKNAAVDYQNEDSLALQYFRSAMNYPAVANDAKHAAGLSHYYLGNRDSARLYFQELQNAGFFDTLKLFPNLKILLGQQETALFEIRLRNPDISTVEATVDYYINPRGFPKLRWELRAFDKNEIRSLPAAIAEAKYRRNTGTIILSASNLREFRSTTLRLVLKDMKTDSTLIDTLLYWPKNWNVRPSSEKYVKSVQMQEIRDQLLPTQPSSGENKTQELPASFPQEKIPSSFTISGQVVEEGTGQPLPGVKITIQSDPNRKSASDSFVQETQKPAEYFLQETTTDARGNFFFKWEKLPPYNLKILASRANFEPFAENLPVFNPTQAEQRINTIRLKPLKKELYEQNVPAKKGKS